MFNHIYIIVLVLLFNTIANISGKHVKHPLRNISETFMCRVVNCDWLLFDTGRRAYLLYSAVTKI